MKILENQLLSNYTTSKIGGRIRWMFFPDNAQDILETIKFCVKSRLPFFVLAGGSNTIFEDKNLHFRQAVINLTNLDKFQILDSKDFSELEFEPGVKLQKLVDLAQNLSLSGVSSLNRIPGTIGGATIGNAGAYGVEIGSVVESVQFIDIKEVVSQTISDSFLSNQNNSDIFHVLSKNECSFRYRQSYFKDKSGLIITKIKVKLPKTHDFSLEIENYEKIAKIRDEIYPIGFVSPGSVFKNVMVKDLSSEVLAKIPEKWIVFNKIPVAKLLESVGSKNLRFGAVSMRPSHANIMINHGGGDASDVKNLIETLQTRVLNEFGIQIEPEIRLVPGNFSKFRH